MMPHCATIADIFRAGTCSSFDVMSDVPKKFCRESDADAIAPKIRILCGFATATDDGSLAALAALRSFND